MATGAPAKGDTIERRESDRLQPALLDRLVDDEPDRRTESAQQSIVSRAGLKRHVLRDLTWLFNCTSYDVDGELSDYPEVHRSVINFGIPPLAGRQYSGVDWKSFERVVHQAVLDFEPRIIPESLHIRMIAADDELGHHNQLQFEIRGEIWSIPFPLELLLRSSLDLETGQVSILDQMAGGRPG